MDADIVAYSSSDTTGVIVGRHASIFTHDLHPPYLASSGSSVAVSAVLAREERESSTGASTLQFARFANTSSGQPLRLDNIASASFDRSPGTRHAFDASATTRSVADSPCFISAARVAARARPRRHVRVMIRGKQRENPSTRREPTLRVRDAALARDGDLRASSQRVDDDGPFS